MSASKARNTDPSPLEFETFSMPNLSNERARLAREAPGLGKGELVERAAALGIGTTGSKADIAERAADAARND